MGMKIKGKMLSKIPSVKIDIVQHLVKNYPSALTKHHAMKAYWGSGCIAPFIL
jgi:hypothetical protein